MPRYRITAPQPGFDGKSASGVPFRDGIAHIDTETATREQRSALRYFRQAGYGVQEVDADDRPIFRDDDGAYYLDAEGNREPITELPADETPAAELPELPADSASRPDWEEAAVSRGFTAEQARAFSNKTELVAAVKAADARLTGDRS